MEAEAKTEKRDIAEWLKFLEKQVANRNSEIALLRSELEEKSIAVQQLSETVASDSSRLTEMTDAVDSAADAITHLKERVRELEEQIGVAVSEKQLLLQNQQTLQLQIEDLNTQNDEMRQKARRRLRSVPLFLVGIMVGALSVNIVRSLWPAVEPDQTVAPALKESGGDKVSLHAKTALTITPAASSVVLPSPSETAVARETWIQSLSTIRKTLYGIESSTPWDISPQYDLSSPIVAITRSQFRDVVTKGLPTTLPSRPADGVLLYEVDSEYFDTTALSLAFRDENIPNGSLCNPWNLDPSRARRLTVVFSNTPTALDCLNKVVASSWFQHAWDEVSLISLSDEPKFSASFFAEKKFVSYQEWHPDWLVKATSGDEGEGKPDDVQRSQRLARIARVLTKSSDVRIQVPTETRSIRSENGSIILPERNGNEATVSFGNFAIIPTTLATGSLKATRISLQTGKPVGRSVMQAIAPNARAVIINGSEQ